MNREAISVGANSGPCEFSFLMVMIDVGIAWDSDRELCGTYDLSTETQLIHDKKNHSKIHSHVLSTKINVGASQINLHFFLT